MIEVTQSDLFHKEYCIMESSVMKSIYKLIDNVAKYDSTVLILGESGVGKELLVKRIHEMSNRREGPLIRINCGAIPDNLVESEMFGYEKGAFTGAVNQGKIGLISMANGGTLFLDEIGELAPLIQVKLLRVIQEKIYYPIGGVKPIKADVRFVAATNRDLRQMVDAGKFREDFYYRLNVIPIKVPSLRERKEDIPQLIRFFLQKLNNSYHKNKTITEKAFEALAKYDWPGNIRELENMMERLMITVPADVISYEDIPPEILEQADKQLITAGTTLKELLFLYESQLIRKTVKKHASLSSASRELGVDVSTLCRKCKKYHIEVGTSLRTEP